MSRNIPNIDKEPLRLLGGLIHFSKTHIRREAKDDQGNPSKSALCLLFIFSEEQLEALEVLCKKSMASAAVSHLRNFFEAELYAHYLSGRQSKRRLVLYSIDGIRMQLKTINGMKSLIRKYPHLKNRDELTTEAVLDTEGTKKEQTIENAEKNHRIKKGVQLPSLEAIAQHIDKGSTAKVKQGNSEQTYNILYRYACTHVHPTPLALERFLASKKSDKGLNLAVLMITNALLLDFLKLLSRNKLLTKPVPAHFTRKFNSLKKQHQTRASALTKKTT